MATEEEWSEVTIDSVAQGGAGVARADGLVLFVEGAVPGDRVQVEITDRKARYAHARAGKLVTPSADRVAEKCNHHGQPCPGASWQILKSERQLQFKMQLVDEALRRLAKLDDFSLERIEPASQVWRYRNHFQYTFGSGEGESLLLGLLQSGSDEVVVPTQDCWIASEKSNRVRNLVQEWCKQAQLIPHNRSTKQGFLQRLIVREGVATGDLQVRLITSRGTFEAKELAAVLHAQFPEVSFYWSQAMRRENTALEQTELLRGAPKLRDKLGDLNFEISPESFFQTNTIMAEHLVQIAIEFAELKASDVVYDLYCGVGVFSLMAAQRAAQVHGIEISGLAIEDAEANARSNAISNVTFHVNDAGASLSARPKTTQQPDVLIVDPPRAGVSKNSLAQIFNIAPKRLIYVSCNPTTLAPDLRVLVNGGYALRRVKPVDMFPQTPHIECVAQLELVRS